MKLLAYVMLLGICSSVAALGSSPSLAQLASGERLRIAYHSQGCFHERQYDIEFQGGASVTARSGSHTVTLSPQQVAGLDRLFAFYRSRPRGGCTTVDTITITRFRSSERVSSEKFVDDSCATYQMTDVTRLSEIAKQLGLQHDTKT